MESEEVAETFNIYTVTKEDLVSNHNTMQIELFLNIYNKT